ncbi:MAG: four helix bundle protein [Candidatus Pacebacteria bacterium]|nr:four helix bundle protein [Candidatus Paceibacterota bacterium]
MNTQAVKKQIKSYRDLIVWQKSMTLVTDMYTLTQAYPQHEIYGITSQLRRASISIPSNIAEGFYRSSRKDYRNFLYNAFGSGGELETQLTIAESLKYGDPQIHKRVTKLLSEVMAMLNTLISKLKS